MTGPRARTLSSVIFLPVVVLAVYAGACEKAADDLRPQVDSLNVQTRRVYEAAILDQIAPPSGGGPQWILVLDRTESPPCFGLSQEEHPDCPSIVRNGLWNAFGSELKDDTREAFVQRAGTKDSVIDLIVDGPSYKLVGAEQVRSMFQKGGGWHEFYQTFPESRGFIGLSSIGFDRSLTQAVVYSGRHCGSLCGEGTYIFLILKNGRWVVSKRSGIWIS